MKNYWTYYFSSLVSLVGSNYFMFTHGWYLLDLTGQKTSVGLTWALFFLPSLIFLPLVGKLMDSVPLKRFLLSFEAMKLLLFVVFVPAMKFYPSPILVYTLAVLYGIAFVPYYPSVYVAVKRLVPAEGQTRYSHLAETSLQIANIVAVFSSGFIYQQLGFLWLISIAACFIAAGAIGMWRLEVPDSGAARPLSGVLAGYRDVARMFRDRRSLSREQFLFGVFHQLPQAVILAGNVPLILYVAESMKKGPKEFGVLDALIGVAALIASLVWSRWHRASQSESTQIGVTLMAGIATVSICLIPAAGAWPYLWMLAYGGCLVSSKILARAAVVRMIPKEQMGVFSTFFQTCGYVIMMTLFFGIGWLNRMLPPTTLFALLGGVLVAYSVGLVALRVLAARGSEAVIESPVF